MATVLKAVCNNNKTGHTFESHLKKSLMYFDSNEKI